jgi:enoyl-CoA hydratase/carnithine racemase
VRLSREAGGALRRAEKDKEVRVIILKGAGTSSSAGHDMSAAGGDAPFGGIVGRYPPVEDEQ